MMIRRPWLAVLLWSFCVAMGVLVEVTAISIFGLWTIEGLLGVPPWTVTMIDSIPLLVAGGLFSWLVYTFADDHNTDGPP